MSKRALVKEPFARRPAPVSEPEVDAAQAERAVGCTHPTAELPVEVADGHENVLVGSEDRHVLAALGDVARAHHAMRAPRKFRKAH